MTLRIESSVILTRDTYLESHFYFFRLASIPLTASLASRLSKLTFVLASGYLSSMNSTPCFLHLPATLALQNLMAIGSMLSTFSCRLGFWIRWSIYAFSWLVASTGEFFDQKTIDASLTVMRPVATTSPPDCSVVKKRAIPAKRSTCFHTEY